MHGRFLTLPAALLMMAFAAAPALADQTIGTGQPADADGVVVSWKLTSGPAQSAVRLRSLQALGGGGAATTATSDPVAAAPGQAIATRLPIAAGGTLTLVDESGSPTIQATVEPDADGDGYGDTTQDACLKDFSDHTAPCGGTLTVGSPLALAPDPRSFAGSGNPMQALQATAPGTTPAATAPGILTRWRLRSDAAGGDTVLQLLRPNATATAYTVVAETAPIHASSSAVISLAAQLPVQAADVLAARSVAGDLRAVAYRLGDTLKTKQPPVTSGQFSPNGSAPDLRLLVQADVEPDADADGKGDVSQDSADLAVTASGPSEVGALDSFTHTYTIRNAGPDAALRVAIELKRENIAAPSPLPAGMTCAASGTDTLRCTLDRLAAGASVSLVPGVTAAGALTLAGRTTTTSATATALTPDANTTNNAASVSTYVRPYVPTLPPQQPFVAPACGHVVRGTRDDDVLRGTAFGDRLVGNDGGDLLKGGGGDDCLEGGAGNDVLDGDDGNDRLAGSAGRDRLSGGIGNDKLTGGRGNDRLSGGPGNDTLAPGDGHDSIAGGAGNDTINSVDGVRETVDCGTGRDTVRADRRDRLRHCEKVTRRR
jgi:hemolysin type calcium-binding protein/uncharacterized protein DUF11